MKENHKHNRKYNGCDPSTQEMQTEGPEVQGHPWLLCPSEASLHCKKLSPKHQTKQNLEKPTKRGEMLQQRDGTEV